MAIFLQGMGSFLGGAALSRRRTNLKLGSVADDMLRIYGDGCNIASDLSASIQQNTPESEWNKNAKENQKDQAQLSLFQQ